jgi:hypothetical protein
MTTVIIKLGTVDNMSYTKMHRRKDSMKIVFESNVLS